MLLIFKFFSAGVILNKRLLNEHPPHPSDSDRYSTLRLKEIALVELDQLLNWLLLVRTPLAADQYEKQRSVIFLCRVPSLIIQIKREKGYKKF